MGWLIPTTDDILQLDIRSLNRGGVLVELGATHKLHWLVIGKRVQSASLRLERDHLVVEHDGGCQVVGLARTACNFGGHRSWFLCPCCYRRVGVLYLGQSGFLCRHCYALPYASQLETYSDRMMRKVRKIRRRLGASVSLLEPIGERPKGMHRVTFQGLARLEAMTTQQIFSPYI